MSSLHASQFKPEAGPQFVSALSRDYLGAHQAAVNAARSATAGALASARFAAAGEAAEARAARGLVSESTSGFDALPTAFQWSEKCITVDRAKARITRLRKSVGIASKCFINLSDRPPTNNVMVTLTVRDGYVWKPRHVSDYIRAVRAWFKDRCPGQQLRYVWVAEIQDGKRRDDGVGRGAIHYHAIFFLPDAVSMPHADRARKVNGVLKSPWWPHGSTNTLASTSPIAYLVSYAKKVNSKNVEGFPRGCRISGVGGLSDVGRAIRRWCLWPAYVQGNAAISDRFRPAVGGGFRNDETGELLLSEFAPTGGGFSSFIRVRHTPRATLVDAPFDCVGPFSWAQRPVTVH